LVDGRVGASTLHACLSRECLRSTMLEGLYSAASQGSRGMPKGGGGLSAEMPRGDPSDGPRRGIHVHRTSPPLLSNALATLPCLAPPGAHLRATFDGGLWHFDRLGTGGATRVCGAPRVPRRPCIKLGVVKSDRSKDHDPRRSTKRRPGRVADLSRKVMIGGRHCLCARMPDAQIVADGAEVEAL